MLVSRRKRYLSGPDWIINTFDYLLKSNTSHGNICQVVLQLAAPLPEDKIRVQLNLFVKKFPILQGTIRRDYKLAPYWKIPAAMQRDVHLNVTQLPDGASPELLFNKLAQNANSPFLCNQEYLDFHLFQTNGRSLLAMRFDHRLFDGRGAESFLSLFHKSLSDAAGCADISFVSSADLTDWSSKFEAGRNVNRALIELSKLVPRSLSAQVKSGNAFKFRQLCFTRQETAAIYEKAYREAGYLMESPYFLAILIQTIHELFLSRSDTGSCYLIPSTMDLRPGKDPLQELFFNHVSYIFYQAPVEQADDLKGLITLFKQQMYDQVKARFPRDLAQASSLTRILPLPLLGKLFNLPMHGKIATIAFSHLGKSSYQSNSFMDCPIENLFHMPRVPLPPGLGFFSNLYDEQLNMMISYIDGVISDDELNLLESGIRRKFGVLSA